MFDRSLRALAAMLVLVLFMPAPAWAGETGKIAGTVTDAATGETLPGVQVVIEGTSQGTVTDADGYYSIINVNPGTYTVVFKYVGFADVRVKGVEVIVDKTTPVDVEMQEAVIEGEEVVVTAERPLVQADRTTTTSFVDEEAISALPVANLGDVINLQAGVVDGHFRGGRTGEVAYMVNGVPINNPLNNSAAFEVEKNMVSGLEVITGVFNAEYGQAMSGVVNIVTKDVPSDWSGSFASEVGAVASTRELEYVRRKEGVEPGTNLRYSDFESEMVPYYEAAGLPGRYDYQASLGGPIIKEKFGFQLAGRYFYTEGNEIARRLFMPSDSSEGLNAEDPEDWLIESTGDQEFVPDHNRRYSVNGTLMYKFSPRFRAEYNGVFQRNNGWNLGFNNYHENKYVPDGENRYYNESWFHLVGLHATFGNNAFGNLSYSFMTDEGESYLYEIPDDFEETGILDDRYVPGNVGAEVGTAAFNVGGNDLYNGRDLTETHAIQADYTNQLNRVHMMKAGASARLHHLWRGNYGIEISSSTGWDPMPTTNPYNRDTLEVRPYELAAYVQDKMEFDNLIVNAGLRFDYFEPDYEIPVDWTQADSLMIPEFDENGNVVGEVSNRKKAPASWQLSPRLGIAFPISATGVIRFSAGLFFQTPPFSILYQNPNYEIQTGATSVDLGNPAMDPERTLQFEVGLQQGLTESMGLELTLFSKDIRNLTGVEIRPDDSGSYLVKYINRDYGTSRGITLSLFQRPMGGLSWDIDYTLQFANGTSSDPREAFQRWQAQQGEILTLVRLDWDRRHVLNNSVRFSPNDDLTLTLINRFQTGRPYTPVRNDIESYIKNNLSRPATFYSDLRVFYQMPFLDGLMASLQVDNLFDNANHNQVYSTTGRADESVEMERFRQNDIQVGGLNSLDEYYVEQWRFSGPRRVILGLRYQF